MGRTDEGAGAPGEFHHPGLALGLGLQLGLALGLGIGIGIGLGTGVVKFSGSAEGAKRPVSYPPFASRCERCDVSAHDNNQMRIFM